LQKQLASQGFPMPPNMPMPPGFGGLPGLQGGGMPDGGRR
jgi:polyadenylation factor subunit 2